MTFTLKDYQEIYNLLDSSPLYKEDCGALCNSVCCQAHNQDMGIYLMPGEEKMFNQSDADWLTWAIHDPKDYDFPPSWKQPVYYARCIKPCPRNKRPIQCRTFPLAPHINEKGKLIIIWESLDLPYSCPLIEKKLSLNKDFVEGFNKGWNELLANPLIRDLVVWDSKERSRKNLRIY